MISQEELLQAKRKAMQLLEYRDRTEKELREKLCRADFCEEAAEAAIDYVKSFGYINDSRFARNYISLRLKEKSRGKLFLELARKGIDRETAQNAWDEVTEYEEADEQALLKDAVRRKYAEGTALDQKKMRSLYGYLMRRGFQYEDISHVLHEMEIHYEKNLT